MQIRKTLKVMTCYLAPHSMRTEYHMAHRSLIGQFCPDFVPCFSLSFISILNIPAKKEVALYEFW
jgi:hypothetical protein